MPIAVPAAVRLYYQDACLEVRLGAHELYGLTDIERDNPRYKRASPMHLFLLSQVQDVAKSKWGSDEPYLISLTKVAPDQLRWLEADPARLKQLTPERFELPLADRFEAMGLCVQLLKPKLQTLISEGPEMSAAGLLLPRAEIRGHQIHWRTNV